MQCSTAMSASSSRAFHAAASLSWPRMETTKRSCARGVWKNYRLSETAQNWCTSARCRPGSHPRPRPQARAQARLRAALPAVRARRRRRRMRRTRTAGHTLAGPSDIPYQGEEGWIEERMREGNMAHYEVGPCGKYRGKQEQLRCELESAAAPLA